MAPKKNLKSIVSGDSPRARDARPRDDTGPALRTWLDLSRSLDTQTRQTGAEGAVAPDTIRSSPVVVTHSASPGTAWSQPLEHYRFNAPDRLPVANDEGFRTHRGREYVDVENGVVMVAVDPQTGLYRARSAAERAPSGPLLLHDSDRSLWQPLHDGDAASLLDIHLQTFRTDLDFTGIEANGEGLFRHDGRLYLGLHGHAYQVMHDVSASTTTQKAWRIVNRKDPVAIDSANIYRASRSGQTRIVRRGEGDTWVYHLPVLKAGLQDAEIARLSKETLLQMYVPFKATHAALEQLSARHNTLWAEFLELPKDSAEKTAKLIALEVNLLKHIHKQADFVESITLNRNWLVLIKANGLLKQELRTFRIERVEFLNRLMATMDLRVKPTVSAQDADSCTKAIVHLNKKLRFIEEREVVMAEIVKTDPGTASILEEIRQQVPSAERINFNKLTLYVHLFAGTHEHMPSSSMPSLVSIDLVTGDLANLPRNKHPIALMLTLDQIRNDRNRFEILLAGGGPNAEYIKQIIALTTPFEKRVESRLTEILDSFDRSTELPSLDQDIDFDFIHPLPPDSEISPLRPPRKVFRTRQHGISSVLVGDTETAPDGSVTVKISNPFQPDGPTQRYEKRQGEWQLVRPPLIRSPRSELVRTARRLLADVELHIADARWKVDKKYMTTNIVEDLEKASRIIKEQARKLEHHENAASDGEVTGLVRHLKNAGTLLDTEGRNILLRKYKSKDVLDVMRLNYLMDNAEVKVSRTGNRMPIGRGNEKSFLDVYSIMDNADNTPLWQAHFHYARHDSPLLNFNPKGGHLTTLEQSRRGIESQRRDELAGLPHVEIWRPTLDGNTASKLFALAGITTELPQ